MPPEFARADALREYQTGAGSDGASQPDPLLSLGGYRSSVEAVSLGIVLTSAIPSVAVLFAGGANSPGDGLLSVVDVNHLTWKPYGASAPGPPALFSGTDDVRVVEALDAPGQYLRVRGTTPFAAGVCTVTLNVITDNVFGVGDVSAADAAAGVSDYRCTVIRNEASAPVADFKRWLGTLGTPAGSDIGFLASSGSGTLTTSGTYADWPEQGWCQVRTPGGTLREVVYYTSRTNTALTVPVTGRGLLGTPSSAGGLSDVLYPTPGCALAIDTAGVQAFGSSVQTVANGHTAPASVTWNSEVTEALGLQIGTLQPNQQVAVWVWRQTPAGAQATPLVLTKFLDSFAAF